MLCAINVFKAEFEDTKIRISKKNRHHNGHKKKYKRSNNDLQNIHIKIEEFEDTKEIIRIRNSKERQHNAPQKKNKRTNNDLPSITHKTKDRVT